MIRLLLPERYCIMKITASRKLRKRMWVVELLQLLLGQHQSGRAGILYVRRLKSTFVEQSDKLWKPLNKLLKSLP